MNIAVPRPGCRVQAVLGCFADRAHETRPKRTPPLLNTGTAIQRYTVTVLLLLLTILVAPLARLAVEGIVHRDPRPAQPSQLGWDATAAAM